MSGALDDRLPLRRDDPEIVRKKKRVRVNATLYAAQLKRFGDQKSLLEGQKIQALISARGHDRDTYVGNLLVQMFAKCGSAEDAEIAFGRISKRNVYSYNLMISGLLQSGKSSQALDLFNSMDPSIAKDVYSFSNALNACARLGDLIQGKSVHDTIVSSGLEINTVVQNALLDMYAKCGSVSDAADLFEKMNERDLISWNTMITAFAQIGDYDQALEIYNRMDLEPDEFTVTSLLSIYSKMGGDRLQRGEAIVRACVDQSVLERSPGVGNAMMNLYAKCGSLGDAERMFEQTMKIRNEISWNAMLAGFALNGRVAEVLLLQQRMELEGVLPNEITLMSVLRGLGHAGKIEEAIRKFGLMQQDHDEIVASEEQRRCLVDLLARAGWLAEAEEVIRCWLCGDSVAWLTLLGGCKIHRDVARAILVAMKVVKIDSGSTGAAYVLLGNIFAEAEAEKVEARFRSCQVHEGAASC